MIVDDTEPERTVGSGPDTEHSITNSFQRVLDALDAARAELRRTDPHLYGAHEERGRADSPPPAPSSVVVEPLWARGANLRDARPAVVGEPLWAGSAPPADDAFPGTAPLPGFLEEDTDHRNPPQPEEPWWGAARRDTVSSGTAGSHTARWPDETPEMAPPAARWRVRITGRVLPRLPVKRVRVAGAFGVGAASGLIVASSLLANGGTMAPVPSAPSAQPEWPLPDDAAATSPEGALKQGDNGQEVSDLQKRLLQVPNIYDDGETDGYYDIEVQAAVARFQEWYGIRGDETGVYGDSTRRDLMSRTQ
ncbi:peptidoglycan-binding domain-containing protein [Streptomyces sp. NPDC006208]|uniref:peptidoglycan-binding domain-containing protein n=1 Tax=Streptomyces sp. NPDC006208 TaxID=3156734 RepID=UPI0033B75BA6